MPLIKKSVANCSDLQQNVRANILQVSVKLPDIFCSRFAIAGTAGRSMTKGITEGATDVLPFRRRILQFDVDTIEAAAHQVSTPNHNDLLLGLKC